MAELDKIVEQLSKLTITEAADLVKKLENAWGVNASITSPLITKSKEEIEPNKNVEKTEFDVVLDSIGDKKISVIKEIKNITGLNLKEAKDFVESAPRVVKSSVNKNDAEALKIKLEATGAKVSLK